ncbi:YciI family protein [Chryseomicrobium excrementi]|nr:YciI family protein [Chryseomicrobium excrementi]
MPERAMYVQTEYNKGTIILAGPFGNSAGGAIIIDSETEEAVIKFAENDPTVKNEIFSYTIHQWDYIMSKFENENPGFDQSYVDYKHKIQKELEII